MTAQAPTVELLLTLPRSEATEVLESVVVEEFKTTLLMSPDEEVPLDAGFFDELGLTSLRLTEIKRRLEDRLGCEISANVVFNRPTVRELIAYVVDQLLPEAPAQETVVQPVAPGDATSRALLDDVLEDLYRA